jgi:16S rRNA (uracil1498-N3)-methyltransferase
MAHEAYVQKIRLFVEAGLASGEPVTLTRAQAHYLGTVMRQGPGDEIALFNGRDGEWRATVTAISKSGGTVAPAAQSRPQADGDDLWLVFAALKRGPTDLVAEKATELGVARLVPVFTANTAATRVNTARLRAIAIEAAEQSRRLTVPKIDEPATLEALLAAWPAGRRLIMFDEAGGGTAVAQALSERPPGPGGDAILIGPEGGFRQSELDLLRNLDFVTPVTLGERILRAETAAIAALACWQALAGDWRGGSETI